MSVRQILNFIDGEFVGSDRRFEDICPATGKVVGEVHEADRDIVDRAVRAARAALSGPWGKLSTDERSKLLIRLADRIADRFDDFLRAEIADTGKPKSLAGHIDIPRGAANFRIFAELLKAYPAEAFSMDTPDGRGALNYTLRRPRGVIGVICPWNLPLLLMTWKVGPALACGNTVVVKPSEETPATAALLGEVMNEVGIPAGVYNVIHGFGPGSAGEFLVEHPQVDGITFTGETVTGSVIMQSAAKRICPVSMELGGKNAAVVFADADLDSAIEGTNRSAFANCGQVCLGTERIYVQRPIFDQFVERLAEAAGRLKSGDPWSSDTTLGPLISGEHHRKVLGYFDLASKEGANLVSGGGIPDLPSEFQGGFWVQPTIWTGLEDDARTLREEIFGPCTHISVFDEEDEVLARVNDTQYGLATSVWTENLARGHRVAAGIDVGIAWVNSWFLRDLRTAFGGSKMSGIGREGGQHAFEFYTETKNVCVKL